MKTFNSRTTLRIYATIALLYSAMQLSAAIVTYEVTFDATTQIMDIYNSPLSEDNLEFWPSVGPNAFHPLWLAPGKKATIYSDGSTGGEILAEGKDQKKPVNDTSKAKRYTVTGPCKVYDDTGKLQEDLKDGESSIFLGPIKIVANDGKCHATGCDFTLGAIPTSAILGSTSASWPGNPAQLRLELEWGTVESIDDTTSFYSIYTPVGGTGCVPEPSTYFAGISALGMLYLFGGRNRK